MATGAEARPPILTLSGENTYSGETSINGGTLALGTGGSLGNTAVTINSGGSLSPIQDSTVGANTGSSGASITVKSGATLDMTSGGTGTVGTFTLKFDLGSSTADQLVVHSGTTLRQRSELHHGKNHRTQQPDTGDLRSAQRS